MEEMEKENQTPEFTYLDPYASVDTKKRGGVGSFIAGFLLATVFCVGIFIVIQLAGKKGTDVSNQPGNQTPHTQIVEDTTFSKAFTQKKKSIDQMMEAYYLFDTENVDTESEMLKGYMKAYGDPYTVYFTKEEYDSLMESTNGVYSGIGVVVQQNASTGVITVVRPYVGAPGYNAGIRAEDILYKVAGEEVTGVSLELVVSKIKGEEGTTVDLTVYRPTTGEYIDMTVERRTIEIETVEYEMLDGKIGYIEVSSFDSVTYEQYRQAFMDLKDEGMEGLIVDLRNNGGGLLNIVVAMLDDMLPEGLITYTEDKNGRREEFSSNKYTILDVPMVILTNGNTASASEIFTGAMHDYGLAEVVGQNTFGKGIVQGVMPLGDGSAVKITTSRYFTPNGICIHGEGIAPDVEVEDDASTEADEQLDRAIDVLKKKMK